MLIGHHTPISILSLNTVQSRIITVVVIPENLDWNRPIYRLCRFSGAGCLTFACIPKHFFRLPGALAQSSVLNFAWNVLPTQDGALAVTMATNAEGSGVCTVRWAWMATVQVD